ncbi:putative hydroxypyruvate isomerase isoform X2 [Hypomesus transpacificus]|uniref:putative hydroxypyruvate isomerase isoform X2 n=1 Tax=Hypomesus transpacificus TaxID=137520 RepID=UPI001F087850|nr:putative hydroxypyruvate isomerase isoform X2 [Hypomesus transpacificus]
MPPLKFCANISWLFTDLPEFSQRIYAAMSAGFQAVEAAWLYDCDIKELQKIKNATGVEVVLINTPPGEVKAGELGLGAVPGREAEFKQCLDLALQYAKALNCKRIHLMAGRVPVGADRTAVATEMEATFVQNLKHAAVVLSKEGITGLIEPINTRITDPRYFLDTPHQGKGLANLKSLTRPCKRYCIIVYLCVPLNLAAAILQKVDHPNIKLQMDIFHWQIMDGNLTQNIQKYFPLIGHIQIAQVPHRDEPDSAGELNFPYLFTTLEELGYQGFIGCEYKPKGWIKEYWRRNK